jgi:UDPglucose 6-dehydrogenase
LDFLRDRLGSLRGKRIALLGLSFKSNTDDMREAPSTRIVEKLLNEWAQVVGHDPVAIKKARAVFGDRIRFAESAIECLGDVDVCVLVTEWRQYDDLPPEIFATKMRRPLIIDGRRIYVPKRFLGKVEHQAIGRGPPLD